MKFGTNKLVIDFGNDFTEDFDKWKKNVINKGETIKERFISLIKKDLKDMNN